MLQYVGHHVTIYEHPRECLNALLPGGWDYRQQLYKLARPATLPVEVLILDLHLPDISGTEVLSYLRAHPHTKSLPLIFCTAAPAAEVAHALSLAPNASFIEKPFSFQELTSTINNALKKPA